MQEGKRDIEAMMYATPAIGALVVARVILGPSFLIKTAFCMGYLFDPHFNTREKMGSALKTSKTKFSALVAAGGISFLGLWVCLVVAYDWAGIVFGGLILVGLIYGCFAGCIHSLPIRPWFVLTTLEPGVWLHVKKKQVSLIAMS